MNRTNKIKTGNCLETLPEEDAATAIVLANAINDVLQLDLDELRAYLGEVHELVQSVAFGSRGDPSR